MEIRIEGFSHKLPLLVERVFGQLTGKSGGGGTGGAFDAASFAREKEALVRKYKNVNMQVRGCVGR